jgi:hypothetical protein
LKPDEWAQIANFFISEEAKFISKQVFVLDYAMVRFSI